MNADVLEILAVAGNLIYLAGAAFQKRWCWVGGGAGSIFYIAVFYFAGLYLESALNGLYALMAVWGWQQWRRDSFADNTGVQAQRLQDFLLHLPFLLFTVFVFGWIFHRYTAAVMPYADAFISVLSVYATWLSIKKYLQHWLWWVFIDAASIVLFLNRKLHLTAGLFFIYTLMAVWGYYSWRKSLENPSSHD
jgi:nicotinamide mononucleotide transporter